MICRSSPTEEDRAERVRREELLFVEEEKQGSVRWIDMFGELMVLLLLCLCLCTNIVLGGTRVNDAINIVTWSCCLANLVEERTNMA